MQKLKFSIILGLCFLTLSACGDIGKKAKVTTNFDSEGRKTSEVVDNKSDNMAYYEAKVQDTKYRADAVEDIIQGMKEGLEGAVNSKDLSSDAKGILLFAGIQQMSHVTIQQSDIERAPGASDVALEFTKGGLPSLLRYTTAGVAAIELGKTVRAMSSDNKGETYNASEGSSINVKKTSVQQENHQTIVGDENNPAQTTPSASTNESTTNNESLPGLEGEVDTLEECLQRAEENPEQWTNESGTAIWSWNDGSNPTDCEGHFATE